VPTLLQLGATAGAVLAILAALRVAWRAWRRVDDFLSDWTGEPQRPGVPERPGVMVRLDRIETRLYKVEQQVYPNHGSSLHDKVTKIAEAVVDES
jgi:hypothetical protein